MFKFEVIVDDKKLSYVLWALAGHAVHVSTPLPVINAKKTRNGIVQQTGGNLLEMFKAHLAETKPKQLDVKFVKQWMQGAGLNPASAGYILKHAQRSKLIRKIGRAVGPVVSYKVL